MFTLRNPSGQLLPLMLLAALAPSLCRAATGGDTAYERVWGYTRLYRSDSGLVRSLDLSGRLQGEGVWYDADQGDFDDWLWRRFRFGFKSALAGDWGLQVEADFDLNQGEKDWYNRLTDAYIGWHPGRELDLRILKHSAGFTLDGATSSKNLITLERNNLTNNLWFNDEYFTGISGRGVLGERWHYRVGVFSADGDGEISVTSGGLFGLFSVGYDWAETLGMKEALVRIDYVRNEEEEDSSTPEFGQVASVVTRWEGEKWGLWTDLALARGYFRQSDIGGLVVMPFYNVTGRVQVVFRYTWMRSDDDNGLTFNRYEREIVSGRGDEYDEFHLGLNLFLYGHKLKWQTGLQYTSMQDTAGDGGEYDGWGLGTGFRLSW